MNSTPQEECSLIFPPRTYEYLQCLQSKLENPYTLGYEIPLKMNMGIILGIIAVILTLIYFSVKANENDLIMSFFR
jgi:hypothetical protein